jgi:hypothetical protein
MVFLVSKEFAWDRSAFILVIYLYESYHMRQNLNKNLLSGHLITGRLSAEEKKKVIDMTKSLTVPRNILTNLKQNNKESATTIKLVYNVRTRWRMSEIGNLTELQYLISMLVEHKYVYSTRCNSEETTLEDIFFAHPESLIKLLNTFSTVLVVDSTYKNYNYQMSLFEIVGCTSTKMMYSVGFAFLHFELEDNFTLALTMVKGLLSSKDNMPKVIVTDRDDALMNVVVTVFPETYTMFCLFLMNLCLCNLTMNLGNFDRLCEIM